MKKFKKALSLILVLSILLASVGTCLAADGFRKENPTASLSFNTLADPHFYPYSMTGDQCSEWLEYCHNNTKFFRQSETMIRTAIETMVQRNPDLRYIFVPGDLTKDSEYQAHVEFAELLKEYEEKYDLEFLVITGNHDINQDNAVTYENGFKEKARAMQSHEFPEVYADLGYDLAVSRYAPEGADIPCGLSYAADLMDNQGNYSYRLIVIDSCKYTFSEDTADHVTGGRVTPEAMQWVKETALDAAEKNMTPMVMIHHGIAAHMELEPSLTYAFVVDDYIDVAESFADWGIHYAFSGHLHTNDIACVINDNGEVIYDVETASVTSYPCTYREMTIQTYDDGESEMSFDTVDFDDKAAFTFDDITYDNNQYKYTAFDLTFGGRYSFDGKADATEFLYSIVVSVIDDYLDEINEAGSILEFLKTKRIDLEAMLQGFLEPYIGDGIKIAGYSIFTSENIMWFINDLLDQIYHLYVEDKGKLYALLTEIFDEIFSIELSSYPCDEFVDTYGFGDKNSPGTLGDAVLTLLLVWYEGNEDCSDNEFINDTLKNLKEGYLIEDVFNKLLDVILHKLLEDNILALLEIRVDKLFNDDCLGKAAGKAMNYLINVLLKGDITYKNLLDTVFALGILPYNSLYDILDKEVLQKYLTFSQFEGIGSYVAYLVNDFTNDINPKPQGDYNVIYSTERVTVPVTRENYRLPTMVSVTLGENADEAYISWFSKSTLEGDIEIYKADTEPSFTGKATETAEYRIEATTQQVIRQYYGIDIGIMGIMPYKFKLNRHTVKLSGLEEGATYYYRVGSAQRGWWSDVGSVTTADGSDTLSFFHMADPQSQTEEQYQRAWAKTLDEAFDLHPDADFIVNTGDLVDHGDNQKQWAWMLNTASENLMKTYMMPAAGNHEGNGTNALDNYFVLPGAPEQDKTSGVYYSFDYNNAHFAVLNSEALDENQGLSSEQIQWLTEDMNSSDAQWKFAVIHKAPYSQGSHYEDDDVCAIRSQLQSLMPDLGIDMVFQGHDHVYMRTGSLKDNALTPYDRAYLKYNGNVYPTQVQPQGTTYVISGTCGVKTYIQNDPTLTDEFFPRGEKILSVDAPMFSHISIEDGVLYFDAYSLGDTTECVDRFAIQKDTAQGEIATENIPQQEQEPDPSKAGDTIGKILSFINKLLKVMVNILKLYAPEELSFLAK